MKITVRKIAEEAGVSPASVSRYINGSEDVSSEIASKVESALFSLGGSPVVRRPRKQIILILLTHLRFDFYGRTLAELLEQEPQSEYTFMLLRYNPQSPETVRNFVSRMHPVGVIYFEEEIDSGILQYLQSCGLRTVMCGGVALDHQSDRVHVNDIAAAYEGTNYLLDLGHREILFLSDDEQKIGAGFQRITGSRKAMEAAGLTVEDKAEKVEIDDTAESTIFSGMSAEEAQEHMTVGTGVKKTAEAENEKTEGNADANTSEEPSDEAEEANETAEGESEEKNDGSEN